MTDAEIKITAEYTKDGDAAKLALHVLERLSFAEFRRLMNNLEDATNGKSSIELSTDDVKILFVLMCCAIESLASASVKLKEQQNGR